MKKDPRPLRHPALIATLALTGLLWTSSLALAAPALRVSAHRGFSSEYPENTFAAFDAALPLGVQAIELDIWSSADRQLVVMHDEDLERTTDCTGLVTASTWAYLQGCDAGSWFDPAFAGEPIPLFSEVLEAYHGAGVELFVEIKGRPNIADLTAMVREADMEDQVTFFTYDVRYLSDLKASFGSSSTTEYIWFIEWLPRQAMLLAKNRYGFDGISLEYPLIDASLASFARSLGLQLNAWTVNTVDDMLLMEEYGVDSMDTDYPQVAMSL